MAISDPTRAAREPAAPSTTVRLTDVQAVYLRALLFRHLQELAETLVDQAHEAHESGGPVIGRDARSTFHHGLRTTAELLDLVGWDTADDERVVKAQLVDLDRDKLERS